MRFRWVTGGKCGAAGAEASKIALSEGRAAVFRPPRSGEAAVADESHGGLAPAQAAEIAAARTVAASTIRPTVPGLEAMLYQAVPILDQARPGDRLYGGRCRDRAGGAGVLWARDQAGAGKYRADSLLDAPPAHDAVRDVRDKVPCETTYLRRPPIDSPPHRQHQRIFRSVFHSGQGILHSVSGHLAAQSSTNRQGRGAVLTGDEAADVLDILRRDADRCYNDYALMLNEDEKPIRPGRTGPGIGADEFDVEYLWQWYWKTNLHNLFHFLSLRADSHAQY